MDSSEVRPRDLIPILGIRNYSGRKKDFYNKIYSNEEKLDSAKVKDYELRHTLLLAYNCAIAIGTISAASKIALEFLVNN